MASVTTDLPMSDAPTSVSSKPTPTPAAPATPTPPAPESRVRLTAILVAVAAVAVLAIGALAVAVRANGDDDGDDWHGTLQDPAQPRPDFTLTDTEGQPYDFAAETQGELTLLFFGYTNCPDICPAHMAIIASALEMPGMPEANVVFVTTDPDRDTPEAMRSWLDGFDADFVGLTGTIDEIAAAESAAFVPGSVRATDPGAGGADGEGGDYEVGHAAKVIAYSPDDLAHVVYPFGTRAEDWAADLPRLLDEYGTAAS